MESNTAIPMVTALKMPRELSCESVRGNETKKQTMAVIALKVIVHVALFDRVLSNFAPTRQWSAGDNVCQITSEKGVCTYPG